ncbi:MAG TPA: methylated-DNA--[protein]-cysteine S-methyltransferase, partial [Parvularculaceae bacterium]|nr:methylated-DNA--[protein]-cysteine S-methyltransferase [Parvularculaceae bacterium]
HPERCAIFVDHVAPASNLPTAQGQVRARRFAQAQGINAFYDVGRGICHQLMIEEHLVQPGTVAVGSDSHSTTYGAIAEELGDKNLSRAVGAAMGANPFPIIIPCHRVTGAGGKMGGFTAPGGTGTKKKLLDIEGAFAAEKLPLFGG